MYEVGWGEARGGGKGKRGATLHCTEWDVPAFISFLFIFIFIFLLILGGEGGGGRGREIN